MNHDFKIEGSAMLNFLKTRKLLLENRDNQTVFVIQLLWFLLLFIFLSGFVIVALVVALLFGCKLSLVNDDDSYIGKR